MDTLPSSEALISCVVKIVEESQLKKAVVYAFRELLQPGDAYKINRQEMVVEQPSALLFIDLEPGVNWSHACLYILYDGAHTKTMEGRFPPPGRDLRLLLKPGAVEDWTLLSKENYK